MSDERVELFRQQERIAELEGSEKALKIAVDNWQEANAIAVEQVRALEARLNHESLLTEDERHSRLQLEAALAQSCDEERARCRAEGGYPCELAAQLAKLEAESEQASICITRLDDLIVNLEAEVNRWEGLADQAWKKADEAGTQAMNYAQQLAEAQADANKWRKHGPVTIEIIEELVDDAVDLGTIGEIQQARIADIIDAMREGE